ncbi:MAG TPA: response regulator [Bacteroidetes bacterium]|nr:transcriptional regulatory protein TcrA [bacterium BMS3Bbin04]HDO64584.1 response regulator [Bacteroidota bacterium]HEX03709.1 response regulator [Bacteroidota bacterium]
MSIESRAADNSSPGNMRLSGLHILAVDDDKQNRSLLSRILKWAGAEVDLAINGRNALEKIAAASYDVIVLDVMMPGWDGHETLKRIRATSGNSQTPILMLSGQAQDDQMLKNQAEGTNEYLAKPFNPTQLVDKIVRLVDRKESNASDSSMDFDSEIDELRVEFIQHHENIVKGYLETVPDHDALRFWAHQFAGSAGSFDFLVLTDRAREIENELDGGTSPAELTSKLADILKRIHEFQTGAM